MRARGVVFVGPEQAELEEYDVSAENLGPHEALVESEYSIISAGTEGSFFTNLMPKTLQSIGHNRSSIRRGLATAISETCWQPGVR